MQESRGRINVAIVWCGRQGLQTIHHNEIDEGDIDLSKVVDMLAKAGYHGDICIEDESIGKYKTPEEKAAVLVRDIAHIKKILGEK